MHIESHRYDFVDELIRNFADHRRVINKISRKHYGRNFLLMQRVL